MKKKSEDAARRDHYQEVTDRIVAALEAGTPPWRRPWQTGTAAPGGPVNAATRHRYRGINTLILGSDPRAFETGDPRWCSYQQAQERGWQVRRGEKATTVFFFKRVEVEARDSASGEGEAETRVVPMLRAYPVFHASQMDGIGLYLPPTIDEAPWREPGAVRTILDASGVPVRVGGDRAFYAPGSDHIQMPIAAAFRSPEGWAATALHELGHATGHPSRLNRDLGGRFGSRAYAMEELRAELASAFLAGELGISGELEQHASYIDGWLDVLRQDKRELFRAAADAQRIADWCLDRHPGYRTAYAGVGEPERVNTEGTAAVAELPKFRSGPRALGDALPAHVRRTLAGGTVPPTAPSDALGAPAYRPPGV